MDIDLLSGVDDDDYATTSEPLLSDLTYHREILTQDTPLDSQTFNRDRPSNLTGAVISKIENIFEEITDCILDEKKELIIRLKIRTKSQPGTDEPTSRGKGKSPKTGFRNITYPNKNPQEAWKFGMYTFHDLKSC